METQTPIGSIESSNGKLVNTTTLRVSKDTARLLEGRHQKTYDAAIRHLWLALLSAQKENRDWRTLTRSKSPSEYFAARADKLDGLMDESCKLEVSKNV